MFGVSLSPLGRKKKKKGYLRRHLGMQTGAAMAGTGLLAIHQLSPVPLSPSIAILHKSQGQKLRFNSPMKFRKGKKTGSMFMRPGSARWKAARAGGRGLAAEAVEAAEVAAL